jgi:recombination protein RecA
MLDLTKTGKIGFMILDSVDAAQSEAQLRKKIGENEMGGISKLMSRTLREYSKLCTETQTTAIFINQIRENPGQMFGS